MLGPDHRMKGGIAVVVQSYLGSRLSSDAEIRYHATLREGIRALKAASSVWALGSLPLVLLSFRPHVVHIHFSSYASFYRKLAFLVVVKAFRFKAIVHCHGSQFEAFHDALRVNAAMVRVFLWMADRCIVLSESWKRTFAQYTRSCPIDILYNAVDLDAFAESGEAVHNDTVLFMGRLGRRKGTYDLVEAIPGVLRRAPSARFVLAGDGDIGQIERLAVDRGVRHAVELPGWMDGARKRRLFENSAVYVLPSYNEGIPVSVLEAMAAGKPVISTPVGGIPEAIEDDVHGFLVQPGDLATLADRLARLLSDAPLRSRLGRAGRQRVAERFSLDAMVDRLLDLYRSTARAS